MEKEIVKINVDDFKRLLADVELIKNILVSGSQVHDPEGELTDWAKKELADARKIPDSENISLEELERRIIA